MNCPKIQITFTPKQLDRLKEYATNSGNSIASVVRIIVSDFFTRADNRERIYMDTVLGKTDEATVLMNSCSRFQTETIHCREPDADEIKEMFEKDDEEGNSH